MVILWMNMEMASIVQDFKMSRNFKLGNHKILEDIEKLILNQQSNLCDKFIIINNFYI